MRIQRATALIVGVCLLGVLPARDTIGLNGQDVGAPVEVYENPESPLHPVVKPAVEFAVSPPLGSLPSAPETTDEHHARRIPIRHLAGRVHAKGAASEVDPVTQDSLSALDVAVPPMQAPTLTFEGLSNNDNQAQFGFRVLPPDTNGDVGPNHYVQTVNLLFRVFDKDTGLPLSAPMKISSLFASVGGPCATSDDGDPTVLYDHLADRWLLSQFSTAGPPYHQCIACSQSGDPTGTYYAYDFVMPNTKFNDYAKFGVWPDAYYMTDNQFASLTGASAGSGVFAFDRAKILAGDPTASVIYFDLQPLDPSIAGGLPSDLDGPPPPPGTPNYFAYLTANEFGNPKDALRLFEFHSDFSNPRKSSFTERRESPIVTAPFDPIFNCGTSGSCIPQPAPASSGASLDVLSDRLMYRLQYRNFGAHESLVVNHTVDVDGSSHAGIRYYEVRRNLPDGSFLINEQASFAPDSQHRWMGSAAMDHQGNLAVGYTVSSSTTFPSLRYAGRLATDPPGGLFQGEVTLQAGSGSQTSTTSRWGDYSMLAVDPTDDCTFWYTNEYYQVSSIRGWQTRVGKFKFPACTPASSNTPVPTASATPTASAPFTISSTGTATATPTVTPTPTLFGITGHVRYFSNAAPVSGASVELQGSAAATTSTSFTGDFAFAELGSVAVQIAPRKLGDVQGAISTLDAVYVLQAVVGSRSLDASQRLACDVTGDGLLTTADAVFILQFQVGSITRFPVADVCQSDWAFVPVAAAVPNQTQTGPLIAASTCQPGTIAYQSLTAQADNQDFLAVLFGDCAGNWLGGGGGGAFSTLAPANSPARLGRPRRSRDGQLELPLYVEAGGPVHALDVELRYDPTQLRARQVRPVGTARKALVESNTQVPGVVKFVLASAEPIAGGREPIALVVVEGRAQAAAAARVHAAQVVVANPPNG